MSCWHWGGTHIRLQNHNIFWGLNWIQWAPPAPNANVDTDISSYVWTNKPDHPRSKKCRNIWQALYKMRGVISARFKNTLLFYGGLELLHGQFKQEETHTDTPGVKSLRGVEGVGRRTTPWHLIAEPSLLGFCDFCNFWNVDSTRPGKKDGCRALSTFRWPVTSSYGLFYLAYEAASDQCQL